MLHIARLRQTWFPCLIQTILTYLNTSDLLFTPDTPGHGARHRAGPRGLAPLPALRHAHLRLPGRAANDPSVFKIM